MGGLLFGGLLIGQFFRSRIYGIAGILNILIEVVQIAVDRIQTPVDVGQFTFELSDFFLIAGCLGSFQFGFQTFFLSFQFFFFALLLSLFFFEFLQIIV